MGAAVAVAGGAACRRHLPEARVRVRVPARRRRGGAALSHYPLLTSVQVAPSQLVPYDAHGFASLISC